MSTETIRRCDGADCKKIIPDSAHYYALEILIAPMQDTRTAGAPRTAKGEYCGAQCVQRKIAETLTPQRPAEVAA